MVAAQELLRVLVLVAQGVEEVVGRSALWQRRYREMVLSQPQEVAQVQVLLRKLAAAVLLAAFAWSLKI
jgi:hypothetical protein